jgi:hypothetical protein
VHARAIVALADGQPVEVQLLYPDMGISEPLAAPDRREKLNTWLARLSAHQAESASLVA